MDKRGQVYFLAALLLALVIFGLLSKTNFVAKRFFEDDFEALSENYDSESVIFLNLQNEKKLRTGISVDDVFNNFLVFTIDFTKYSKTQNPDFGLIHLFDLGDKLFVGNYLDRSIAIYTDSNVNGARYLEGCKSLINAGTSFDGISGSSGITLLEANVKCNVTIGGLSQSYVTNFVIGDFNYTADIISDVPEIVIVSQEFKDEQRKVFLNEDFIKGNKIDINSFCSASSSEVLNSEICSCSGRNKEKCETLNSKCKLSNEVCVDA